MKCSKPGLRFDNPGLNRCLKFGFALFAGSSFKSQVLSTLSCYYICSMSTCGEIITHLVAVDKKLGINLSGVVSTKLNQGLPRHLVYKYRF